MPKKTPEAFNYLSNDPTFVPDPEIEEFMEEEIAHAPKDPELLAQRLHNNTAASPRMPAAIWMPNGKTSTTPARKPSRVTVQLRINLWSKRTRGHWSQF